MLKGIDPLLSPDWLAALAAMGHGDEIALVDANYPAASAGPPVIEARGATLPRALAATLSLMPLDDFGDGACWRMAMVADDDAAAPVFADMEAAIAAADGRSRALAALERHAFYARAAAAFAIVATGERRLYGNVLLRKGVVGPP